MPFVGTPSRDHEQEQFDYAWKWFQYHAEQRIKMFNYMWIAYGLFVNAIVAAINAEFLFVAGSLCCIAGVSALIFVLLDRRNQMLTWAGEDVLAYLEDEWLFRSGPPMIPTIHGNKERTAVFGILRRFEQPPGGIRGFIHKAATGQHRFWIKGTACLMAFLFFLSGGWILLFPDSLKKEKPACERRAMASESKQID